MKHTQGNWTVDNNNGTHGVCRIVADKPGTDRVLGIMECCGASPEREANAKLIAAAPELLAALESIVAISSAGVIHRNETGKPQWSALDEITKIVGAAIAKAKGGE